MNMKLLCIFISFNMYFTVFCQVKYVDLSEKVINLSSLLEEGRINTILFSTYGCIPCEVLKEKLLNKYAKDDKFNLIYCTLADKEDINSWNYFKNLPVPKYWSRIENISEFPILQIYSPLGNLNYKHIGIDSSSWVQIQKEIDNTLNNFIYYEDVIKISNHSLDKETDSLNIIELSVDDNNQKEKLYHEKSSKKKNTKKKLLFK